MTCRLHEKLAVLTEPIDTSYDRLATGRRVGVRVVAAGIAKELTKKIRQQDQ